MKGVGKINRKRTYQIRQKKKLAECELGSLKEEERIEDKIKNSLIKSPILAGRVGGC